MEIQVNQSVLRIFAFAFSAARIGMQSTINNADLFLVNVKISGLARLC
jgi:hypothetical protein